MANSIKQLSYANTFGDWVVTTDNLVNEVNTIGFGNYVKPTGVLTLASTGTALQVANNSVFQGNVVIQGTGTALQVSHDAIISGNLVVMGNTTIAGFEIEYTDIQSNTIHANAITSGVFNSTGNVAVGAGLTVGTDATINGSLTVVGQTLTAGIINASGDVAFNNNFSVGANATINGNLTVVGNTNIQLNEVVTGSVTANALYGQANATIMQTISDSQNTSVGSALAFSIALG